MSRYIKIRRIKNISKASVPIQIDEKTTIYIEPGEELQNQRIYNYNSIKEFVKVSFNLNEIPFDVVSSKKIYLKS